MKEKLLHQELTGQIIGAAMTVLNELKPGLDEKLYENALVMIDWKQCWTRTYMRPRENHCCKHFVPNIRAHLRHPRFKSCLPAVSCIYLLTSNSWTFP